jgi:hypothetical protein
MGGTVRVRHGVPECLCCGQQLDLKEGEQPRAERKSMGTNATVRVLVLHGREIHRCDPKRLRPPTNDG